MEVIVRPLLAQLDVMHMRLQLQKGYYQWVLLGIVQWKIYQTKM